MTDSLVGKAESEDLSKFFRLDLFWSAPDHAPIQVELDDGRKVTAQNVSSYKGVRVWEVPAVVGSAVEAQLDHAIAKNSTNRLVIFRDGDKQVWRWPSRTAQGGGVISRPARHVHKVGSLDPQFEAKLDAIRLPTDVQVDVNELLSRVRGAFDVETKNETKRASKLMAQMYAAVEKGYAPGFDPKKRDHEISVTLARVLFLLFGDDTEMWKSPDDEPLPDLFQDFIKDHTSRDGSDIAERLNELFAALNKAPEGRTGLSAELAVFPYVNGGIFHEPITLPQLDNDFRKAALDASAVDWSTISPAIFGSMFQSVRDAQTRRELGEHYTSEENILKTLNPLFLDELRGEFDAALLRETDQKRINALNALWTKLGDIRFMDPACGCGNFIIVAYRELRDLELSIMGALADLQQGTDAATLDADWTHLLKVTLDHFCGIEIDEWPARIAETAMFLVDRQSDLKMKERFGAAPERLPIQKSAKIVVGNALRTDWRDVLSPTPTVVVAGNPPFLGDSTRSREQLADLQHAWGGDKVLSRLDYVTGWHAKALDFFDGVDGSWAFVTTSSISQGDPVPRLFGAIFATGWEIKFAHRTFGWTSEAAGAAAVHCVIVGFSRDPGKERRLFTYSSPLSAPVETDVSFINAYLIHGPNVLVDKRTKPLHVGLPQASKGSEPADGGHLLVNRDEVDEVLADPIAKQYVRPFRGARELLWNEERWCLWLVGISPSEIEKSPLLSARIEQVRHARATSKSPIVRESASTPHLFRIIKQPSTSYVCIPRHVSEARDVFPVAHYGPEIICGDANFLAADPDGYLFALVSSRMFLAWQKAVGGRLKSDLRFGSTLTWNTLPLPKVSRALREEIVEAGARIISVRDLHEGASLASLYAPREIPGDLQEAHATLDRLVDGAFGAGIENLSNAEREALLFSTYQKLAGNRA